MFLMVMKYIWTFPGFGSSGCAQEETWCTSWRSASNWETNCRGIFSYRQGGESGNTAQEHRSTQEVSACPEKEDCGDSPWLVFSNPSTCCKCSVEHPLHPCENLCNLVLKFLNEEFYEPIIHNFKDSENSM